MTIFVIACAVMVAVALVLIVRPLLQTRSTTDTGAAPNKSYVAVAVVAVAIPLAATLLYAQVGRLSWQKDLAAAQSGQSSQGPDVEAMVAKLEKRLSESPNDMKGWIMLGRSNMALERPTAAINAYQHAYDLSGGNDSEAAVGLGEAMIAVDERAINGRAGELFEAVLAKEPDNLKALWYGAINALTSGNLPRGYERLQRILVLNPPEQIRTIIERQLQDIEQQMKAAGQTPPNAAGKLAEKQNQQPTRSLNVQVSLAPGLAKDLDKRTPLFVLARDPNAPGPPLAAVRRAAGDLPLSVKITDNDAMIQGRGIGSVQRVQVVARLSKTGTPQAQPGDLYGDAVVEFKSAQSLSVTIVIDHIVSKQ